MNLIFKASDPNDPSTAQSQFKQLLADEGVIFRRTFQRVVNSMLDGVSDTQINRWIEDKDLQGFLKYASDYIDEMSDQIPETIARAAQAEIDRLSEPGLFGIGKLNVRFNPGTNSAADMIENSRLQFIKDFTANQRDAARQAMADALRVGQGPAAAARNFRDAIGLTQNQYQAVRNYQALLENQSRQALDRQMRDARFDRTIERVIANDDVLSAKQIERMVGAYTRNMRNLRAETIARTETMKALNAAKNESWRQIAEKLGIKAARVIRTWIATDDDKTRDTHAEMDRQEVEGLDTPFESPSGEELMYPGDPDASAEEIVNCRCTMTVLFPPSKALSKPVTKLVIKGYDPDEPRDEKGRWTSGGAASTHLFGKDSSFEEINEELRSEKNLSPGVKAKVAEIDKDFAENANSLPDGTVVYRGMSFEEGEGKGFLRQLKEGSMFQDLGYTATTTDKSYAETAMKGDLGSTDVLLTIEPSPKAKGLYNSAEKEYVFNRGNHFKVISVKKTSTGSIEARVKMTRLIK